MAGLVTAIVLLVSLMAPVCEAQCDLKDMGTSCHTSAPNSPTTPHAHRVQTMAPMPGMASSGAPDGETPSFRASQVCEHHICVQQEALLTRDLVSRAHLVTSFQAIVLIAALLLPVDQNDALPVQGSPPVPKSSPVTLHTTLRV